MKLKSLMTSAAILGMVASSAAYAACPDEPSNATIEENNASTCRGDAKEAECNVHAPFAFGPNVTRNDMTSAFLSSLSARVPAM